jgi:hypothetical protein
LLIQSLLPLLFCLIPFLAAALVALATPTPAMNFYLQRIQESKLDWLILGLGLTLFLIQIFLTWRALRWRGNGFDERVDRWINNLAQAAEWFPILGLIGTVTGILATFSQIGETMQTQAPSTQQIIASYAPAITATGSGLFMALINILPAWVVLLGRDLILMLGGSSTTTSGEVRG